MICQVNCRIFFNDAVTGQWTRNQDTERIAIVIRMYKWDGSSIIRIDEDNESRNHLDFLTTGSSPQQTSTTGGDETSLLTGTGVTRDSLHKRGG
jgi:hypothetical protein